MSMPNKPEANFISSLISSLQAEAGLERPRMLPPVHLWNPENCGDIGLEIRKDGSWWQSGIRFTREKLIRLFSTILRKDPDGFYLVTPHEKVFVRVEDAPFIATRIDRAATEAGDAILVTTNVGDVVAISAEHPLRVQESEAGEPAVYVDIRNGLEARLARPPWYELVGLALADPQLGQMAVQSCGVSFPIGAAE